MTRCLHHHHFQWSSSLPFSAVVMNTHFDRACHIKQYFTHAAWRLASMGRKVHIKEAYELEYYHLHFWQVRDVINSYFFLENTEFYWLPWSNSSVSQRHVGQICYFFLLHKSFYHISCGDCTKTSWKCYYYFIRSLCHYVTDLYCCTLQLVL